jgi:23S rRNA G2445 N2-methylase RlmL
MEELFEEEIRSLLDETDELEILWIGVGASRFLTKANPAKLVRLRSIDFLGAYLHHSQVNLSAFDLDDINKVLDPQKHPQYVDLWQKAFNLWGEAYHHEIEPILSPTSRPETVNFAKPSFTLKFKVKGRRRGDKCKVSSQQGASRLGEIMYESFHWLDVSMRDYDMEVIFDMNKDQLLMAISLTRERVSIRNRVACGPTTLDAANAYALLKWAKLKPGDVVLDPMAGAGTIPIEGSHIYPSCHFIISDHSMLNMDIARQNVKECAGTGPLTLFCCDAAKIPLRHQSVDVVVSDLPFGMRHGSASANKSLYPSLFKQMERLLRSGGRAVLLTMAKSVIKQVIDQRRKFGWTLVRERPMEVGGYLSWVFELIYEFLPFASGANRELVHKMTGRPRLSAAMRAIAAAKNSDPEVSEEAAPSSTQP